MQQKMTTPGGRRRQILRPRVLRWQLVMGMFILLPAIVGLLFWAVFGVSPEPIRLGFVGQVSGANSSVPLAIRNTVQMRVDEINRAGGIKGRTLELVARDNGGDPDRCARAIAELHGQGVRFLLGPVYSKMAEATAAALHGRDMLCITPAMSTVYLSRRDDNILRVSNSNAAQGELLAKLILDSGQHTVAAVYDLGNKAYTEPLVEVARRNVEAGGGRFVLVRTLGPGRERAMLALARDIHAQRPDAVIMGLSATDGANLAQQLRKIGSQSRFYGVSWTQTNELLTQGGRAVEGMVLMGVSRDEDSNPAYQAFRIAYKARFHQEPSYPSVLALDAVNMLIDGMRMASEVTPEAVKRAILEKKTFQGIRLITLDAFGDKLPDYSPIVVRGGVFHVQ